MTAKIVGGKRPSILAFFHCKRCIKEMPKSTSPKEWARLSVGWTKKGLQVWCVRHEMNVYDLDFRGQKVKVILHGDYSKGLDIDSI